MESADNLSPRQVLDCLDTLAAQAQRQIVESRRALAQIAKLRAQVLAQQATLERISRREGPRRNSAYRDFSFASLAR